VRAPRPSTGSLICELCASPKTLQAHVCQACDTDRKRARPIHHGTETGYKRCRCYLCTEAALRARQARRREASGLGKGRPQPADHPWRQSLTRETE
jgi:hypothetical protein